MDGGWLNTTHSSSGSWISHWVSFLQNTATSGGGLRQEASYHSETLTALFLGFLVLIGRMLETGSGGPTMSCSITPCSALDCAMPCLLTLHPILETLLGSRNLLAGSMTAHVCWINGNTRSIIPRIRGVRDLQVTSVAVGRWDECSCRVGDKAPQQWRRRGKGDLFAVSAT